MAITVLMATICQDYKSNSKRSFVDDLSKALTGLLKLDMIYLLVPRDSTDWSTSDRILNAGEAENALKLMEHYDYIDGSCHVKPADSTSYFQEFSIVIREEYQNL